MWRPPGMHILDPHPCSSLRHLTRAAVPARPLCPLWTAAIYRPILTFKAAGRPLAPADETRLRRGLGGYALRHPLLGSLLFLEASPAAHGATLVLDQTPGDGALAERGWLVRPAAGRYAVFRGDLLHGVMPGAGSPAHFPAAPAACWHAWAAEVQGS